MDETRKNYQARGEMLTGEVARYMGVNPVTVKRWAKSEKLPYRINCYGWPIFDIRDVEEWKRKREGR